MNRTDLYEPYLQLFDYSHFSDSLLQKKFDEILSMMTNNDSSSSLDENESEVSCFLLFVGLHFDSS